MWSVLYSCMISEQNWAIVVTGREGSEFRHSLVYTEYPVLYLVYFALLHLHARHLYTIRSQGLV